MSAETLLVGLVLFAGLWLLFSGTVGAVRRTINALWLFIVSVAVAGMMGVFAGDSRPLPEPKVHGRPIAMSGEKYVTSTTCRACHPNQYASWHSSYHRTMTQVASPDTVVADFENLTPPLTGFLSRRGDEHFVRFRGRDGSPLPEQRIVLTTGSHRYQAYWYSVGQGRRLQLVPAVYLIEEQQWIPRDAAFLTPPDTAAATLVGEWNANCIKCHTTHGQPRVDNPMALTADVILDTHVAEFGIGCEACHGPAEDHVRANRNPLRRYELHRTGAADPTIIQPERLDHRRASDVCGQCHSVFELPNDQAVLRYMRDGFSYWPGDDLSQTRVIMSPHGNPNLPVVEEKLRATPEFFDQRFWSDGMVRVSGREYNGLVESPCYQRGEMSCLSCHTMHKAADDSRSMREWANDQLKPNMDGDQACFQCHREMAANIDQHTHHLANSSGSRCYNCHMPFTTYGLLKAIRSHQIDSPSVANTLETGRPNACNLCHLDQTLAWTADYLTRWYGLPAVELGSDEQSIAASLLWTLRGDAGQRALVAWSMGWSAAREASGDSWLPPFLAQLLDDPYAAVRYIAIHSLRVQADFAEFEFDFMGPPADRAAAKERALNIWKTKTAGDSADTDRNVLIGADGTLRQSELKRLLQQRNDRPVNLAE